MHDSKHFLVVSQVYPYPLHDGARMDIFFRLKALFELGHCVTLIAFYNPVQGKPSKSPLNQYCKEIYALPFLRRKLSKVFQFRPYSIASKENWQQLDLIINSLKMSSFDAVIAESHHVLTAASRVRKNLNIPKLYLRSHNDEPRFMKSVSQSSELFSLKWLFYRLESMKYSYFLPTLMETISPNAVWHISLDECQEQKKTDSNRKHCFLPAGIDVHAIRKWKGADKKNVLFAGALFSPNNYHGLLWYLNEVHPSLVKMVEGYNLLIAGSTFGVKKNKLARLLNVEGVTFYDTPEEMEPIYDMARVFINPMLFGAGVKLKTLDAIIRGLPVVTTSIGNEGTGLSSGKEVFVADTPDGFIKSLTLLLNDEEKCEELSRSAADFVNQNYDQKRSLESLIY